jgi:ribosomal protein S27AE
METRFQPPKTDTRKIEKAAEASIPFWARCADCAHVWAAAYYPLNLTKFAEIAAKAVCPKCGGVALVADQNRRDLVPDATPAGPASAEPIMHHQV